MANMKKWYKIMFVGIFLQIPLPSLNKAPNRNCGSTLDVLGPLHIFKTTNSAGNQEKCKKLHMTANSKVEYFSRFHQKLGDPIVSSPFLMTNCCQTGSI